MNSIALESDVPTTVIVDELDRDDEPHSNGATPHSSAAYRSAVLESAAPAVSATNSRILTRLLSMADSYRESGSLRQAIEIYLKLIREHDETPQGHRAEERLLDVARSYERSGELRQARGIYEQLL
jgi:tetratricopeptide (TPR) repeat protein